MWRQQPADWSGLISLLHNLGHVTCKQDPEERILPYKGISVQPGEVFGRFLRKY